MDISCLEGTPEQAEAALVRHMQLKLRAACPGRRVRHTAWKQIAGNSELRIVRTKGATVGVVWNALGEYRPRGCIQWMPIHALLKNYRAVV